MPPRVRGKARKIVSLVDLCDDGEEENEDTLDRVSNAMKEGKTTSRTKTTYGYRIKSLTQWFVDNEYDNREKLFEDDALLKLKPVTTENSKFYQKFFASLMSNAHARSKLTDVLELDTDRYPDPFSSSTIEGYRSAIV